MATSPGITEPPIFAGMYAIGPEGSSSQFLYGGRPGNFVNNLQVANTSIDTGTIATQDQPVVGHDGQLFGIDTMPGQIITQTGQAYIQGNPAAAMDAYSALSAAWNQPSVRLTDGSVVVLRVMYPGSSFARRIYGRGRKIVPVTGLIFNGVVGFVAQFQGADDLWYSDTLSSTTLTMAPSYAGGLTPPVTPPFQIASQVASSQGFAQNFGPLPTWPVITFAGPISYPALAYSNTPVKVGFNGILGPSDQLVIDTRPWARTALMNGSTQWQGIRVAGSVTGNPMIAMQLQTGTTKLILTGQDFTGRARCTIAWRSAYRMLGGSLQ